MKVVQEDEATFTVRIDGGPRATLRVREDKVYVEFLFMGEFTWQEGQVLIQGLNQLAEVGDQLSQGSGNVTGLKQLSSQEIDMAAKAAKKKAVKAARKTAAKTGAKTGAKVPRESAAQLFQDLIMEGNLSDDKIFARVQAKFGLNDKKRSYVAWYRSKLTKDGKKPPAAVE